MITTETKKKGQHRVRKNHKKKKKNKTKHGREDERREVTLKAIRGFAFEDKEGFQKLPIWV
jgi:hypothetical protein